MSALKILSIDDSKLVHVFLKELFSETQHVVDTALDGDEGLAKQKGDDYDVILLDWEMPGKTGPEVLEALRAQGFQGAIIMLTSKSQLKDIQEVMSKGANEYIMKPFTQEIIFGKIQSVLGREVA